MTIPVLKRTHAWLPSGPTPPVVPAGERATDALSSLEGEGYGEGWAVPAADEESAILHGEFENLWPLQLVDLRDDEMLGTLYRLLRTLPQVKPRREACLCAPDTC